jgi:hypothetical protein
MPKTACNNCGGDYFWQWEDAFYKFGFGDGDAQIETDTVWLALENAGYTAVREAWGMHNVVITSIRGNRQEMIPENADLGYDDPREYLPRKIVQLLDQAFPNNESATS